MNILFMLIAAKLGAVGIRLPNQNPDAIARGNAFVATADNASAVYYNPAGITQLEGHSLLSGIYAISANTEYRSGTGQRATTDDRLQAVPQLYYVYSPQGSKLSYGLGLYAPYGLSLDWGDNAPFRNIAQNGKLLYLCANPVIAWKSSSTLSIAIGPTFNYSDATLERGIGAVAGDKFRFQGDGFTAGFNAGVLWNPHPKWYFGANYRYFTEIEYEGESSTRPSPPLPGDSKTSGSLYFPQFVAAGISFRPSADWNIELDIDWTDWDGLNEIVFENTGFGDVILPLHYKSSFMYEIGVTRNLAHGYYVSIGYIFSENSSPDRYFNPIIPDSDLHLGSVGFARKGTRWDWSFGYHFAYNSSRKVSNSLPGLADGTYETLNHAFNFSLTLKF